MDWNVWLAFVVAAVVIAVTPGPGAVLSIATGLRHGYPRALKAICGLEAALLIQVGVVALGLGAVLAASSAAFLVIKVVGAGYLVWLGVRKWRAPIEPPDEVGRDAGRGAGFFLQGVLVNLTNPKAILFMVALMPQFIDAHAPQAPQFAVIGATMVTVDLVVMSIYALLAGRCRGWLRDARAIRTQNRLFGALFVGAGAALAASSR